jgi:hypothetical protein
MRFYSLLWLLVLCPFFILAQTSIAGKVLREDTKNPVAGASVFLSDSSYGTVTRSDGSFELNNVRPGQYTFVISHLGYSDFVKTILVSDEPIKLNVNLAGKSIILRGVTITTGADWKRNFALFRKEFIGTDENAKYCEIINPEVLDFTYYSTQKVLLASADKFIIVENRALGYRVKFLLDTFKVDQLKGIITAGGQRVFEELSGSAAQKKKWHANRDSSYYGSSMHFFRSLYKDRLAEEDFEMHRYTRYLNPARPPEEVIIRKFEFYNKGGPIDSAKKYWEFSKMSKYYHEVFYPQQTLVGDVLVRTAQPGIFAFSFPDCMFILYKRKDEKNTYRDIYRPLNLPNYQFSLISVYNKDHVCFFDMNGIVVGGSPLYEGNWSGDRLSQLLPVDYQPNPLSAQSIMLRKP